MEEMNMNYEQLTLWVQEVSMTYFKKPFRHQAVFNKRLRTTGGRYLLQTHNIEINPKYLEVYGEEEVEGIIKHELCHYHLHIEGKGYRHGDMDFQMLMQQTGSPRYCRPITASKWLYICESCHQNYPRMRKINTQKYCCSKCSGRIYLKK